MHTLDALKNQMIEAEPVLKALDSELENISFDPSRSESIDAAIKQVIQTIDLRFKRFETNPILGPMAQKLKIQYVEGIQARVADSAMALA